MGSTHAQQTAGSKTGVDEIPDHKQPSTLPAPWEERNYTGCVPRGQRSLTLMMGGAMARYLSPL